MSKKEFIDEITVIDVKDHHEIQRSHGRSPKVRPRNVASPVGKQQRKRQNNYPNKYMYK